MIRPFLLLLLAMYLDYNYDTVVDKILIALGGQ